MLRMYIRCQSEDVECLIAESGAQGSSGLEARLCEGRKHGTHNLVQTPNFLSWP